MSRTFKIVKINNKDVNRGRYTTNSSPSSVAKKVFSKLYTKMKNTLTTFMIKETTQGSKKKIYGPYKGKRIKLKKPRMVKFKGTNKPVPIRYETKIYKVKDSKKLQKGGMSRANRLVPYSSHQLNNIVELINELIIKLNFKGAMGYWNSRGWFTKGYKDYAKTLQSYVRPMMMYVSTSKTYNKTLLNNIRTILNNIRTKINASKGDKEIRDYISVLCNKIQMRIQLLEEGKEFNFTNT